MNAPLGVIIWLLYCIATQAPKRVVTGGLLVVVVACVVIDLVLQIG